MHWIEHDVPCLEFSQETGMELPMVLFKWKSFQSSAIFHSLVMLIYAKIGRFDYTMQVEWRLFHFAHF